MYEAKNNGHISYLGNKVFSPIPNIYSKSLSPFEMTKRVEDLHKDVMWGKIAKINHRISMASNEYFNNIGAISTLLPLTTRMISSPGAAYGRESIKYTSDTCPITLKWFDLEKPIFLSESSQIYLEIALLQQGIDQVYAIYNSFRKEISDATHLSEFHHIEYEGKITQKENEKIALGLVKKIINDVIKNNSEDLEHFLTNKKLSDLENLAKNITNIPRITFNEALEALRNETLDKKYETFSLENFGAWEEIKLTEIYGNMVAISEYPLLEIPFYHAQIDDKFPKVADNTDFIWCGYREFIGSGHRVRNISELEEKAKIFQLPKDDYTPYMKTRKISGYKETSGFGLGWERMLQGMLDMPFIWSVSQFPRIDKTIIL